MVKKVLFFIFTVLAVAAIIFTVLLGIAAEQESDRVSRQPGASGVDYLAACMLKSEAVFIAFIAFIITVVTFCIGLTVKWRK